MRSGSSQLTIGGRLWIVVAVTGLCVAGLSAYSFRILKERTSEERSAKLRGIVELGHGIVAHYGKLAESGALPKEEAQRLAMETLRSLRFEGGNYLFLYDRNVVLLLHPNPDLQGKSQAHLTDPTGKHYTVEFVRTAEGPRGEGTVDYLWPKPGGKEPVRKISHVKMYAPWGWIVCAGLYLDDLDEAMAAEGRRVAVATGLVGLLLALAAVVVGRGMRKAVDAVCSETDRLRAAVSEGRLSDRASEDAVGSEFRTIVQGMNETMDAYARPIEVTSEYLARISSGDIPAPITDEYRGDFNRIKDALNRCIAAVQALVADTTALARAGVDGKLSTRADAARHQGDFRKIVQGVNDTLDAVVGPISVAATYVDRLSRGDVPEKITAEYHGDFDLLKQNLNTCIEAVNRLVADAKLLSDGAVAGALGTRADASRHQGDFRAIVQGVNDAIDAIVVPFRTTGDYLDRISHGEIPARRTSPVRGDIVAIQAALNRSIDSLSRLVADADRLAQAAVKGQLSTRADVSAHEGAFRNTLEGVNRTLDAVIAPVKDASAVLEQLAERDLRARVSGEYQGDHARIAQSVNGAASALHDALAQVAQAVDQVSSAATQIASSSQAVASGASEQASALQATSESLASVAGVTKQTSDSAQQANLLAQSARAAAADGSSAVGQMQGAMARIKASAEGTSQIIRDINDIAFQTNLLALNAAVEAARAGEAGRGFAVVAEEVRSLALRAKEAASKTEELIRQSVKEAGEGEVTARQVSAKLTEIAGGVGKLTDIVAEIAAAAREQTSGLDQVTGAVGEMDRVTQQNAASAEESSSAASELSGQAEELASMVAAFQVSAPGSGRVAARQPARARALTDGAVERRTAGR